MTEYPIRGGDIVKVTLKGTRAMSKLDALWLVQVDRTTMAPSSLDTSFIISAHDHKGVLSLLLPVLGKDHDDYANSEWTIEPIGLDTRSDTSNKYVLAVGSW